ncbi:MAG: flippase [Bacteriovoracaceae bacterium]|jgi:polysaccharide transporter, PST family|nr:flippase [Bacteriovoracaceae bacterium]
MYENIFRMVTGIFIGVWLARFLGPSDYGQFNYIISFVTIFYPIYNLGTDDIIVKNLLETPLKAGKILGSAFCLRLLGSIISVSSISILGYFSIILNDKISNNLFIYLILYSSFFSIKSFDVIYNWLQANFKESKAVLIRNASFILVSLLKIYGITASKPWSFFIYIACLEIVFVSFFLIVYFVLNFKIKILSFDMKLAKRIFSISRYIMLIVFFEQGISKIDQIMVGNMLGLEKLGIYTAASKLISLWLFLPFSFAIGLYPLLIKSFTENDLTTYAKYKNLLYGSVLWLAIIFTLLCSWLSDDIINILYGERFLGAGKALMILSWQVVFLFFTAVRNKVFIIEKKEKVSFLILSFTFVLNIPINYFFINKWGIYGASAASLVAYCLGILLLFPFSNSVSKSTVEIFRSLYIFPLVLKEYIKKI